MAMPVAMPIWRNVELMPDAIPAWAGCTTPIAVEASGGLTRPTPMPADDQPGDEVRPLRRAASSPRISSSPMPTSTSPVPISAPHRHVPD